MINSRKEVNLEMNLSELEYMVTIAESSSLSEAAGKLFISQPAISNFIKRLEERDGVLYFNRTNKYLNITLAGELYVQYAKKILKLREGFERSINEYSRRSQPIDLVVGVQSLRSASLFAKIYTHYPSYFPNGKVRLVSGTRAELLRLLADNNVDCILLNSIDIPKTLESHTLRDDHLLLVTDNETLPCQKAQPYDIVDLEQIKDRKFFLLNSAQSMRLLVDSMLRETGISLSNTEEINRHEASINLASMGFGFSFTLDSYLSVFHPPNTIHCYEIQQYRKPVPYSFTCLPGHLPFEVLKKCLTMMRRVACENLETQDQKW